MSIDAMSLRAMLANYPTGICVITARNEVGDPVGMVVGTFTSVSLDPPLVGFLPGKQSRSWQQIEEAGRFCVNILAMDQRPVCDQIWKQPTDKFAGLELSFEGDGLPCIAGAVAWIFCDIHGVLDAGDHWFVLGRVTGFDRAEDRDPILFYRGRYGGFADIA